MNTHVDRAGFWLPLLLIAALSLGGCGGTSGGTDLGTGGDLANPGDMAIAGDLAKSSDMAASPDLASPSVTGIPTDCAGDVTASDLYTNLVQKNCATASCHGSVAFVWHAQSSTELKSAWVNKASTEAPSMPYVTPGSVDKSWVMYKLTGQMSKVVSDPSVSGDPMPLGGAPLGHDDLCQFINWIKAGAQ